VKIVRFLIVLVIAYVFTAVLWSALTWYGIVEPWLPTMAVRPTYFAVTLVAAVWVGLRVADRIWPLGKGSNGAASGKP